MLTHDTPASMWTQQQSEGLSREGLRDALAPSMPFREWWLPLDADLARVLEDVLAEPAAAPAAVAEETPPETGDPPVVSQPLLHRYPVTREELSRVIESVPCAPESVWTSRANDRSMNIAESLEVYAELLARDMYKSFDQQR